MRMSFGPIVLSAVLTITAVAPMRELKASVVMSVHSIAHIKAPPTPDFIAFAGGYGPIGENKVEFVKVGFKGIVAQTTGIPELELYHVGFLKKGAAWTSTQTDETRQIQSGHMAHINKMASSGKLVAAGPILDDGDLRGIFLFKVSPLKKPKPSHLQIPRSKPVDWLSKYFPGWALEILERSFRRPTVSIRIQNRR